MVYVVTAPHCPNCKAVKEFMDAGGIEYQEIDGQALKDGLGTPDSFDDPRILGMVGLLLRNMETPVLFTDEGRYIDPEALIGECKDGACKIG